MSGGKEREEATEEMEKGKKTGERTVDTLDVGIHL